MALTGGDWGADTGVGGAGEAALPGARPMGDSAGNRAVTWSKTSSLTTPLSRRCSSSYNQCNTHIRCS